MKKTLLIFFGLVTIFIAFISLTKETCACFTPSEEIVHALSFLVDDINKNNTDYSNICQAENVKTFMQETERIRGMTIDCFSNKNDYAFQTRLPNKKFFCIDRDSKKETLLIKDGAVSCE